MTGLWYFGGIAAGIAIGWAAANCHLVGWAPIGLVSLTAGMLLGAILAKLASHTVVTHRRHLLVGAVIFAVVAIVAEHAWLYRDFRRQWGEARAAHPQVALFRPEAPWSPSEYFRREWTPGRTALWCVDAALIVAGAIGVVGVIPQKPKAPA